MTSKTQLMKEHSCSTARCYDDVINRKSSFFIVVIVLLS